MAGECNPSDVLAASVSADGPSLRTLVDLLPVGVVVSDAHGTITISNKEVEAILRRPVTGRAFGPDGGYTLNRLDGSLYPPEEVPLARALERGETTRDVQILVRSTDGAKWIVLVGASPIRNGEGQVTGAIAVFQNVTHQQRNLRLLRARERQQAAIARLGQEALAGTDLSSLLDDAVRLVANTLDVEFAKVLEVLPGKDDLLLRAGVGWTEGLVGHAIIQGGADSQAGYTLQSSTPVIVEDLRTEARFQGPPLLCDHGVVSGISVIIAGHPRPFGVLGAHTRRKRRFNVDDVNFVQSVANVLAMAIDRMRTEDALRQQAQIIDQVHDAVVSTDLHGYVSSWNKGADVAKKV